MGRRSNSGLDYFSFDVDFFNDQKIQFIQATLGNVGELIAIKLLCLIYRQGYYIDWGEDEAFLFANSAGPETTKELVDKTVAELIKRKFFSEKHYKKYKILTSNGIQARYLESTRRRQNVSVAKEYLIVDIRGFNVDLITTKENNMYQSKVKESKVKYSDFVMLTDSEHKKLVDAHGEESAKLFIEKLDHYKGSNGKKYNSDYHAILTWVVESVKSKPSAKGFQNQIMEAVKDA